MAARVKAPKITAPLNYTTKVKAATTANECTGMLAAHGAEAVGLTFDDDRQPNGLNFRIDTDHGVQGYRIEVNSAGVLVQLETAYRAGVIKPSSGRSAVSFTTAAHAHMVAWRQVKDWLEANLAMIEASMWGLDRVMLPWMLVAPETDVYQAISGGRMALGAGIS
jgi:hypothetical protein